MNRHTNSISTQTQYVNPGTVFEHTQYEHTCTHTHSCPSGVSLTGQQIHRVSHLRACGVTTLLSGERVVTAHTQSDTALTSTTHRDTALTSTTHRNTALTSTTHRNTVLTSTPHRNTVLTRTTHRVTQH